MRAGRTGRRAAMIAGLGGALATLAAGARADDAAKADAVKADAAKADAAKADAAKAEAAKHDAAKADAVNASGASDARPARPRNEPGTALFVVGLGLDLGGRWFTYSDGLSVNVRNYDVFGAPMPTLWGEVYPLAGTSIPVVRDLGIVASYAHAFGLKSATSNGKEMTSSWDRFFAGLRFRLRTGSPAAPVLGLTGGFGIVSFGYDASKKLAAELPTVSYKYLRVGLDGRIPIWRFALLLDASYLGALSSGEVYERFRDPSIGGVELGGGVAVVIASGFEARLGARYTRYFSAFSPVPGDEYVAGGALDELLGLHVGAAYAY